MTLPEIMTEPENEVRRGVEGRGRVGGEPLLTRTQRYLDAPGEGPWSELAASGVASVRVRPEGAGGPGASGEPKEGGGPADRVELEVDWSGGETDVVTAFRD